MFKSINYAIVTAANIFLLVVNATRFRDFQATIRSEIEGNHLAREQLLTLVDNVFRATRKLMQNDNCITLNDLTHAGMKIAKTVPRRMGHWLVKEASRIDDPNAVSDAQLVLFNSGFGHAHNRQLLFNYFDPKHVKYPARMAILSLYTLSALLGIGQIVNAVGTKLKDTYKARDFSLFFFNLLITAITAILLYTVAALDTKRAVVISFFTILWPYLCALLSWHAIRPALYSRSERVSYDVTQIPHRCLQWIRSVLNGEMIAIPESSLPIDIHQIIPPTKYAESDQNLPSIREVECIVCRQRTPDILSCCGKRMHKICLCNLRHCPNCNVELSEPPVVPAGEFPQIDDEGAPEHQKCYICGGKSSTRKSCCKKITHETCLGRFIQKAVEAEGHDYQCSDCRRVLKPPYIEPVSVDEPAPSPEHE
jgi:hypothetical protein